MRPSRPTIRAAPGAAPPGKPSSEEIQRLVADFNVIAQRVNEIANESNSARISYVNSLRSTVSSESDFVPESKLSALERVLTKVAELDRLVLMKTAPETTPDGATRRSSKSIELSSLPTHLFVINRLLDLHAEAKRVTVVRTHTVIGGATDAAAVNEPPLSPRSNTDKKAIESFNSTITQLSKQIEESGGRFAVLQQENLSLQTTNIQLIQKIDKLSETIRVSEAKASKLDAITLSFEAAEKQVAELHKQLENTKKEAERAKLIAIEEYSKSAVAIASKATSFSASSENLDLILAALDSVKNAVDTQTIDGFPPSQTDALDQKSKIAVRGVVEAMQKYIQRTQIEINLLLVARDNLESELATNSLQRDILNSDLSSVNAELLAMKGAFSEMESEAIDLRRKLDIERGKNEDNKLNSTHQSKGDSEELQAAQRRLAAANDLLQQLQDDLAAATNRNVELEKLPSTVANLEARIIAMEAERGQLKASIIGLTKEVESYKKLTESLKEKMKSASNSDRDFLDTFEEVMRDEMATMKSAFEAKLKAAREESDQLSRKHSQEIIRLQQSNSPGSKLASSSRFASPGLKMAAANVMNYRDA